MYWINGILQAQLPLTDRSVHLGDGFFNTARLLDGRLPLLEWHLERLVQAAQRLMFAAFDADALRREMLAAAAGALAAAAQAHYPRWRREGERLCQSPVRLARNPLLAGIKHNNWLEQVLIRAHLERDSADEALVLNTEGVVVECCSANLFWLPGHHPRAALCRRRGRDAPPGDGAAADVGLHACGGGRRSLRPGAGR